MYVYIYIHTVKSTHINNPSGCIYSNIYAGKSKPNTKSHPKIPWFISSRNVDLFSNGHKRGDRIQRLSAYHVSFLYDSSMPSHFGS